MRERNSSDDNYQIVGRDILEKMKAEFSYYRGWCTKAKAEWEYDWKGGSLRELFEYILSEW